MQHAGERGAKDRQAGRYAYLSALYPI